MSTETDDFHLPPGLSGIGLALWASGVALRYAAEHRVSAQDLRAALMLLTARIVADDEPDDTILVLEFERALAKVRKQIQ